MIRAALLTPNFSLGGAERWVLQLLKHVDPQRVQWTGLGISGHGGADPELCRQAAALTVTHSHVVPPERRSPLAHPFEPVDIARWHPNLPAMVQELARDADCLLTWGQPDMRHWFSGLAIPRICCSHGTIREPALRPVTGLTHLAAVAEAAMGYFDGRVGAELPRQVIYNGSDPEHLRVTRCRTNQRRAWGYGNNGHATVIGHIGRHSPEKNYLALAKALEFLPQRFKAVYYGRDQQNYHAPAADLVAYEAQYGNRLRCYLPESRVGNLLNALDVLVVASHNEACSLVMIEAWLTGLPVVATPVGSVPELQAKFGELVIPVEKDPAPRALANAIRRASSPDGRRIARRALAIAQQHFTIRTMADHWADYLERVCSSTEKPAG